MNPMMLAGLMGGGSFLDELTTGRQQQKRDSELKAMAYRMSPYMQINPENFKVYQPDALSHGIAGATSGYQLGSGIARDKHGVRKPAMLSPADADAKGFSVLEAGEIDAEVEGEAPPPPARSDPTAVPIGDTALWNEPEVRGRVYNQGSELHPGVDFNKRKAKDGIYSRAGSRLNDYMVG
jgi:hypothetical protein